MKAVILAIVAFGTLVSVLARSSTGATFTDQAKSNGNTFATAALHAPTVSASVSGSTVNLSWNNPDALAGSLPNVGWVVLRAAGTCLSPGSFSAITGSPFAIGTLAANNTPGPGTHCYAVSSKFNSWQSPQGTAQVLLAGGTLQLSGTHTLVTSGASGGPLEIEATTNNSDFATWSKSSVTVTSHSGWSVNLNIVQNPHDNFNASNTYADVVAYVLSSGACSTTAPSSANTLASALLVPIVLGNIPIALSSSGTLATPTTGTLCLRVTNHSGNSGNAHDFSISTAGLSTVTGPF